MMVFFKFWLENKIIISLQALRLKLDSLSLSRRLPVGSACESKYLVSLCCDKSSYYYS